MALSLTLALGVSGSGPSSPGMAATNVWESSGGPACDQTRSLAEGRVGTGFLVAVVGSGRTGRLFASGDRGRNWAEIASGLFDGAFSAAAIHPGRPARIVAANRLHGVLQSDDFGDTWTRRNAGLPSLEVRDLRIAQAAPFPVYALAARPAGGGGLFVSRDDGASWQQITPAADVNDFGVDPERPSVVYASTSRGVFRTRNGGRTWSGPANSPPERLSNFTFGSAGAEVFATWQDRLFRTPGGLDWQAVSVAPSNAVFTALATDPRRPDRLTAGLVRSDGGPGIAVSNDGGRTWVEAGLRGEQVLLLLRSLRRPRDLWAGTRSSLFRGVNAGRRWRLRDHGVGAAAVSLLVSAPPGAPPRGPWRTFAAAQCGAPLFFLDEAGRRWRRSALDDAFSIAIDPQDPAYVLVGFRNEISMSRDGGETLAGSSVVGEGDGEMLAIEFDPDDSSRVYSAMTGQGLFISEDRGTTWEALSSSDVELEGFVGVVRAVSGSGVVYAGGRDGLARSDDRGVTWQRTGLQVRRILDLAIDRRRQNTLVAVCGTGARCLYRSTDGGASWRRSARGLPPRARPSAVVGDAFHRDRFYLATTMGVFRSTNGGRRWKPFSTGINDGTVLQGLSLSASGKLYVGTFGQGVLMRRVAADPG